MCYSAKICEKIAESGARWIGQTPLPRGHGLHRPAAAQDASKFFSSGKPVRAGLFVATIRRKFPEQVRPMKLALPFMAGMPAHGRPQFPFGTKGPSGQAPLADGHPVFCRPLARLHGGCAPAPLKGWAIFRFSLKPLCFAPNCSALHGCWEVSAPMLATNSTHAGRSLQGCRSSQAPMHGAVSTPACPPSTPADSSLHPCREVSARMQTKPSTQAERSPHPCLPRSAPMQRGPSTLADQGKHPCREVGARV